MDTGKQHEKLMQQCYIRKQNDEIVYWFTSPRGMSAFSIVSQGIETMRHNYDAIQQTHKCLSSGESTDAEK